MTGIRGRWRGGPWTAFVLVLVTGNAIISIVFGGPWYVFVGSTAAPILGLLIRRGIGLKDDPEPGTVRPARADHAGSGIRAQRDAM